MATCVLARGTTTFSVTGEPSEDCGSGIGQHVAITAVEYQEYQDLRAGIPIEGETTFDTEAYDLAYGGIISGWALGLGIGFLLAIIAKLKR